MAALRRFDFWPKKAIDIEKPASVSEPFEFIWRLPLYMEPSIHQMYVKNYFLRYDLEKAIGLHFQVHYPFHMRYQPIQEIDRFTQVVWPLP